MKQTIYIALLPILIVTSVYAQSPFNSNKQSMLFSNAQSGASERWISLFAPTSLSANYRLIFPTTAPAAGQMLNIASISGSDYTMQWASGITGTGTSTQIAFWNSSSTLSSSSNLYWDNTNGRLGIGTSSPGQKLEVMNGNVLLNNNNNTSAELRISEPSTSGSNYTAFKTQAQSADITYVLPATQSTNSVLVNDGSGTLIWKDAGTVLYSRKTSDESIYNNTMQDDDHLYFDVAANQVYEIDGMLRVSASATGELKLEISGPAGGSILLYVGYQTSAQDEQQYITALSSPIYMIPNGANQNSDVFFVKGTLVTSSTAGTVKLRWAQTNTDSGVPTTFYTNSYIKLTRVE